MWWNPGSCLSLLSVLLLPLCTCTSFVPLSTHWLVLPLSPRSRKGLPHNSQALYRLLSGSVPGKVVLSGSAKSRNQGLPVQSWQRGLTSLWGESSFKRVVMGWANIPTVFPPPRLECVPLPMASSQEPQEASALALVLLQNYPGCWWPCAASHRKLRWS